MTKLLTILILSASLWAQTLNNHDLFSDALLRAESNWGWYGARVQTANLGPCNSNDAMTGEANIAAQVDEKRSGVIYLNRRCRWTYWKPAEDGLVLILQHEVGHILGLEHSPDYFDVMYHEANGQETFIKPIDYHRAMTIGGRGIMWRDQ